MTTSRIQLSMFANAFFKETKIRDVLLYIKNFFLERIDIGNVNDLGM